MRRTTIAVLTALTLTSPIQAGGWDFPRLGIFRKKKEETPAPTPNAAKNDPNSNASKMKQLVETLKADPDESKRLTAVGELRELDPRKEPDLIPTLVSTLQKDPSAKVRSEVAGSIGHLKPVAQQAGLALEQTQTLDPSEAVRKAAKDALWQYHLAGYRSSGANPGFSQTNEPPMAKPRVAAKLPSPIVSQMPPQPIPQQARPITSGLGKGAVYPQTTEPPLARPKEAVVPPSPSLNVPALPRIDGSAPTKPVYNPPTVTPAPIPTPTLLPAPLSTPVPVPVPAPATGAEKPNFPMAMPTTVIPLPAAPIIPNAPAPPSFAPPPPPK
ncbi:MAG: HEAT repeat domain-containing protein [Gemmataceae bacterium]